MKILEKNKAIALRRNGKTYREIQRRIPVSKGTLSYWLRDVKLNRVQLKRIYKKNLEIRRKFIEYNQIKRKQAIFRKDKIAQLAQKQIKDLSR